MSQPDYKALSRGVSRDMSSAAIARRLRIVDELLELAQTLGKTRLLGSVEGATRNQPVADARVQQSVLPLEERPCAQSQIDSTSR